MKPSLILLLFVTACAGAGAKNAPSTGYHQEAELAENAPEDRPVTVQGSSADESLAKWQQMIAPHVEQARATYPEARRRYLAGLPRGETFFVTTILRDAEGHFEQVFVAVDRIEAGTITGRLFSEIQVVAGHEYGETLQVPEAEIVDWTISKADGQEEGNYVGKFLDGMSAGAP